MQEAERRVQEWIRLGYSNRPLNLSSLGLASLPELPDNLLYLICYSNQLTSLPALPNSLLSLSCGNNQLTSLPVLPNSLKELHCAHNQLTLLPALPDSLQVLSCYNNELTLLPELPNNEHSNLYTLECSNNRLTSLPELPYTLQNLMCDHNEITTLTLPENLYSLNCSFNQLKSLPIFPNTLIYIIINNNPITQLHELSDDVATINFKGIDIFYRLGLNDKDLDTHNSHIIRRTIGVINEYVRSEKRKLKNLRSMNIATRHTDKAIGQANIKSVIGSFLTGKSGTVQQQNAQLQEGIRHGKGGGDRNRKTKKRATRKYKKRASRKH